MSTRGRDRISLAAAVGCSVVLLAVGAWYLALLDPLVDRELVLWTTGAVVLLSASASRGQLRRLPPLDPARPSTQVIDALTQELADRSGVARPRTAFDDSGMARAVANVGAVELGPRTETLVFTEQVVADLEAGRFDPRALRGVILHELGHLHHDHVYQRLWMSVGERLVRVTAVVAAVGLFFSADARAVAADAPELLLAVVGGPIVVATLTGIVFRSQETQADAFAVRHMAGRELLDYLHWVLNDLGPLVRLDRSGLPTDPQELGTIRAGLARLVAEAEALGDEDRAGFFRIALAAVDRHSAVVAQGPAARAIARLRHAVAGLVLTWLGILPAARTHPPIEDRIARIGAELGRTAA